MDCDDALVELEAYLDAELKPELRRDVESHLVGCSHCFDRGEFRKRLRDIVRRKCSEVGDLPPAVATRIRAAIITIRTD
jgi:anti-sigma factor (TIGR02949 family)